LQSEFVASPQKKLFRDLHSLLATVIGVATDLALGQEPLQEQLKEAVEIRDRQHVAIRSLSMYKGFYEKHKESEQKNLAEKSAQIHDVEEQLIRAHEKIAAFEIQTGTADFNNLPTLVQTPRTPSGSSA